MSEPVRPHLVSLGRGVAQQRRIHRLTQAELGERAGLSRSTIANIEVGRQDITITTLLALADALGLAPSLLLPGRVTGLREMAKAMEAEAELAGRVARAIAILEGKP